MGYGDGLRGRLRRCEEPVIQWYLRCAFFIHEIYVLTILAWEARTRPTRCRRTFRSQRVYPLTSPFMNRSSSLFLVDFYHYERRQNMSDLSVSLLCLSRCYAD